MITEKEVKHVAKLARLKLTEEEKSRYTEQFSSIIEYFNQLKEVNTENVPTMDHTLPLKNVMRDDQPELSNNRSKILQNAPVEEEGYFKVPKI